MSTTWIWIGIAIYVVIAGIAAIMSRSEGQTTMSGYFLGNRKMGGFVSAMSYSATTYSAFMLIGLAGLTYTGGIGALGFELIYLMGVTLVLVFGPRFWLAGKKFGYVTPSEMLGDRYENPRVGTVAALCSLIFLIPYAAVQLAGVGYLVSGMTGGGISFTTGTLLATALAIVFSLVAGLRSVAWTDTLQALFMIVTASIVVIIVINHLGGVGGFYEKLTTEHPGALSVPGNGYFTFSTFLGLTLPWMFFSLSNPQVSQRLFTPGSFKDMRRMLLGFMIFGFIYTLVAVVWGLAAAVKYPDLGTADLATPTLLGAGVVPTGLSVVVMIGIIAAAVSTIDSIMLTLSSMVARDVFVSQTKPRNDKRELIIGKVMLPVIAVLAYLFTQLELSLIAVLSVSASAGLLVMVPALVGAFYWRRGTAAGAFASIIGAGIIVFVLEATQTRLLGQGSGVWGLLAATLLFVGVSLMTKKPEARAQEFVDHVQQELARHRAV